MKVSVKFNLFDSSEEIFISHEEHKNLNENGSADRLSILHLNISSIKKSFEKFKLLLSSLSFDFSIICFSETCLDESSLTSQSLYELPRYKSIHQVRNYGKGGGVSIYIKDSINFKPSPDLSINNTDVESISIEHLCKKKETN